MAANLTELLDALPSSEDKHASLLEINALLCSMHLQSIRDVVQNVSFHVIFDCWSCDESETLELCCQILQKLMGTLSSSVILHEFHEELSKGLLHSKDPVKLVSLLQFLRCGQETLVELLAYVNILQAVVKLLADKSIYVARRAHEVIMTLGSCRAGLELLFSNQMTEAIMEVTAISDIMRFRVYELIVDISKQSAPGLEAASHSGWLLQLVNEVHKDDILVRLNGIELLSNLAMTEHGLSFLDQQGIVGKLNSMIESVETNPMRSLLLPGLIKFFGGVAQVHPKEVLNQNNFVSAVFDNISSNDIPMRILAIDTVGFIASTVEGKLALEKLGSRMDHCMKEIGQAIRSSTSEIRDRAVPTTASIIRLKVEEQTVDLLSLTEKWFSHLAAKPFETIMGVAKQPFIDLRCSAYGIISALALQPWGQKIMNEFPGFNEYILDRSTEKSKEGKDSKFNIIKILAESPTVINIFGQPFYIKVKALNIQGPFHVQAQSDVAFEGDT